MLSKIKKILLRTYRQSINIRHLRLSIFDKGRNLDIVHIAIHQITGNVIVVTHYNKIYDADMLSEIELKAIYNSIS